MAVKLPTKNPYKLKDLPLFLSMFPFVEEVENNRKVTPMKYLFHDRGGLYFRTRKNMVYISFRGGRSPEEPSVEFSPFGFTIKCGRKIRRFDYIIK